MGERGKVIALTLLFVPLSLIIISLTVAVIISVGDYLLGHCWDTTENECVNDTMPIAAWLYAGLPLAFFTGPPLSFRLARRLVGRRVDSEE